MKATKRQELRKVLERLAEAAESILITENYPCDEKVPKDLKKGDSYFQNTPGQKLAITYKHGGHLYTVEVIRRR